MTGVPPLQTASWEHPATDPLPPLCRSTDVPPLPLSFTSASPSLPQEQRSYAFSGCGRGVCLFGGAAVFGVDALGFFELVFEDDDAAGRLDGGALVDQFPGAGGDAQLVAGVAAVASRGAQGVIRRASPMARRKLWVVPSIPAARPMVQAG